ncbi:hypothetical protein FSP39_025456 [Pinctada imbricata]|uniref:Gastrin/cholecystokinin type B receptor n=1 Tax=Pinctada imbricata TaxID=66713 RepID=A0AA88YKA3_PINIB|nr:hypothetical protein FSP39_025456 [Pinctada imbricata]
MNITQNIGYLLQQVTTDHNIAMVSWNSSSEYDSNLTAISDNVSRLGPWTYPQWSPPPLTTLGYVVIPLYVLIFLASVIGNTLVILTLIQNERMRTVTNVFLLNLSISDLLLAVFCMPFTFIPVMLKNFIFGEIMCISIRYLQGVAVAVSCFTLVAISLERYFAICRPLESRAWQTRSHSYKLIIICWLLALAIMVPIPVFTKHLTFPWGVSICKEQWNNHEVEKAYQVFITVILLLIPLLIITAAYGLISLTLFVGMKMDENSEKETSNGHTTNDEFSALCRNRDSGKINGGSFGRKIVAPTRSREPYRPNVSRMTRFGLQCSGIRQSNSEKSRASKRRVIKMLFAVVAEFFICWTPMYVIQTWIIYDYDTAIKHINSSLLVFVNLFGYVSSCCNPITYCFLNRNFRQGFISVFRCSRKVRLGRLKSDTSYSMNVSTMSRTHICRLPSYDKVNCTIESDENPM